MWGLMTQIVRHNTSEPKIITEKEHWRLQRTKLERGKEIEFLQRK